MICWLKYANFFSRESMEKKKGAVLNIRELFTNLNQPMTLNQINKNLPELKASEIGMAMAYLYKQRYVTREKVDSLATGRKQCFLYTYSQTKIPKVVETEQA